MFKILLLQAMQGLSDERCGLLIKDRLSLMRILGLIPSLAGPVLDGNTTWTVFRRAHLTPLVIWNADCLS